MGLSGGYRPPNRWHLTSGNLTEPAGNGREICRWPVRGSTRVRLSWIRLASEKWLVLFSFCGNIGQYKTLAFLLFPFSFIGWSLGGALYSTKIHRWLSLAGIWNFQRIHRPHFVFFFMLCFCHAAVSYCFGILFQEWIWEGTGAEQKRSSGVNFGILEWGIFVGKACMNKREGKRREREVEEERKTERKINSYYETNTTFKQVLEGPDHCISLS